MDIVMKPKANKRISGGGKSFLGNYQTMCYDCNQLKGNQDLTVEQILKLSQEISNEQV